MTRSATIAAAILGSLVAVALLGGTAAAYPQFQLSKDQTCSGCHTSPAGGGMLNENGLNTAEGISQYGTAPGFFYMKEPPAAWLELGGDARAATGVYKGADPEVAPVVFPMQLELYARAKFGNFSLYVAPGARPATEGNENATRVWAREHYLQWQQKKGETTGLFVRAGHFMPVFGLRLAEHPVYTRRFGGTQLYSETYGLAVEYIDPKFEVHATGFIEDPVIDTPEHSDGGAALAELRLSERLSVGGEFMYTQSVDDKKFRFGATGKLFMPGPQLLLQLEVQFMNQLIDPPGDVGDAIGAPKQLIGYLLASRAFGGNGQFLVDLGLGHYDENVRIKNLDKDCVDLNVHWFTTSHLELILTSRFEMVAFGSGGESAAYSLLQVHYRL